MHFIFSARDSNRFSVSVNLEPKKKVTFNLTYEELLKRELGVYRHVINLNPGQVRCNRLYLSDRQNCKYQFMASFLFILLFILFVCLQVVEDLTVDVYIHEERNITKLRAPEIQSGNEIDPDLENKGEFKVTHS